MTLLYFYHVQKVLSINFGLYRYLDSLEERMICLGQQHYENKAVVVAAVVEDLTI